MVTVKLRVKAIDYLLPFVLIIVCMGCAKLIRSELAVLSVFLATLGVYAWRKYDCRLLIITGIILLVVCAVLVGVMESFANQVAICAYYFLVIGVIELLIEYIREKPKHRIEQLKEK